MDDSIAPTPDTGGDPIAAYRAYLEANTGDRPMSTALPPRLGPPNQDEPSDPDDPWSTPDQGAMPNLPGPSTEIAPPQGEGPATNDGGVDVAPPSSGQGVEDAAPAGSGGAGPSIAPVSGGGNTPTLSAMMPNPVGNVAQAPLAPNAPNAPNAPLAPNAPNAPNATLAPTVGGQSQPPDLGDESKMTPASGHVIKGKKTADGKPVINVQPPDHDPADFDGSKLSQAHTISDVFDALPKKKQTTYMDWWEEQHGNINQRFDQMQQELGQRPDPNRQPTRTEKFTELMNFGLSLLQNARRGNDPMAAMGASAQEALGTQAAKQQQQTSDYDSRMAGIQKGRQDQLKDLGNYGSAVREDALIQNANVRTAVETARAMKPPRAQNPVTRTDAKGNQYEWDPESTNPKTGGKGVWQPSVDAQGNKLPPMLASGSRGGTSKAPARQAELDDLINNKHVDPNDALHLVYGQGANKQSDPTKTYNGIYSKARGMGETEEDAAAEADRQTSLLHGAGWRGQLAARNRPTIAPKPPAVAPPLGKIGTDAQGNRWKNDGRGNPVLVPAS